MLFLIPLCVCFPMEFKDKMFLLMLEDVHKKSVRRRVTPESALQFLGSLQLLFILGFLENSCLMSLGVVLEWIKVLEGDVSSTAGIGYMSLRPPGCLHFPIRTNLTKGAIAYPGD